MKRFTVCMILALVGGVLTALPPAVAQQGDPMPRVEPHQRLTGPRIDATADSEGLVPLRAFCPEDWDTCRKYWDYTINFVQNNTIPTRERELLILRTAWLSRGNYIWGRHDAIGQDAGLSEEEIVRITVGPDAAGWSNFDSSLLRAADELHRSRFISEATWSVLAERYSESELTEVVLIVGNYTQLAMFQNTLGVQLPAGFDGLPEGPASQ